LNFRAVVALHKSQLNYNKFKLTHDDWYQSNKIPNKIKKDDTYNDYNEYENEVYKIFQETLEIKLETNQFFYKNKKIQHKRIPIINGKSGTFWHITSSGKTEETKLPDYNRYEVIAWPGYILTNCIENCKELLIWENKRKCKTRVLIWCKMIDYLIILEERESYYLFWTAYPITYEHTRRKLQREYDLYKQSNK